MQAIRRVSGRDTKNRYGRHVYSPASFGLDGLGKAVAADLAKHGGRVLMACRSGHPQAGK